MGPFYCSKCRINDEINLVELCELHRALSVLYHALLSVIEYAQAEKEYTP